MSTLQALSREATPYYSALFIEDSPPAKVEENMILAYIPSLVFSHLCNE